jgi:hypothetical protein
VSFVVTISGPRTQTVTLDSWRADISNRGRTLYADHPNGTGKIGGATYVMFWVTVADTDHRSEPWISAQRHATAGNWQHTSFPTTADQLITVAVAQQLQRHGGFDCVWDTIYRATAVTKRLLDVTDTAAALRVRAAWLDECEELSTLLTSGALTIRRLTHGEQGYGSARIASVQDPFEKHSFNSPAARLFNGPEQVGWISESGNPVPLRPRPDLRR